MRIAVLRSVVFSIRSLDGKIPFKWENELMKRSFEAERTEKELGRGVASKGDEHFDRLESREFVLSTINPTRKRNKVKSINDAASILLVESPSCRRHFFSAVLLHLDLESDRHLKIFFTLATIVTPDWNSIKGNLLDDDRDPISNWPRVAGKAAEECLSAYHFDEQFAVEKPNHREYR